MLNGINSGAANNFISNLNKSNKQASKAMTNISSGVKINTAKDNPAGLVISSKMYSQLSGMARAYQNTQEAYNMFSIAEGGLSGISSALGQMKNLTVAAGNTGVNGKGQTGAYQAQMNNLLATVNHITSSTNYGSKSLLNGTQSLPADSVSLQSGDPANILNMQASDVELTTQASGQGSVAVSYSGDVADQAEKANVSTSFGGGSTTLTADQQFSVTGVNGQVDFSFAAGTTIDDMVSAINARSEDTGVEAYATDSSSEVRLASLEYGSAQSVQVDQTTGDAFAAAGSSVSDAGQDLTVTVDGEQFTGQGLSVEVETANISGTLEFNAPEAGATETGVAQSGYDQDTLVEADQSRRIALEDSSGGIQLQLGEGAQGSDRDNVSLPDASLYNLGRVTVDGEEYSLQDLFSGGSAALDRNPDIAQMVVNQAIDDVSSMRADIGAYQSNTLSATANNLEVAMENITASNSAITDTDIAKSVTEMTSAQIREKASIFGIQKVNEMNALRLSLLP